MMMVLGSVVTFFGEWRDDFAAAMQFLTRLPPMPRAGAFDLRRGGRVLPLIGAVIGVATGAAYWLLLMARLPSFAAAAMSLAIGALMTGGLHEDGLADTADGFGGGQNLTRKLEIMSDSRIGSYGVLALILAVIVKAGCVASLDGPRGFAALVAAHVLARTAMLFLAFGLPAAKKSGLGASVNTPSCSTVAISTCIGIAITAACSLILVMPAVLILAVVISVMRDLARRQIGGFTGDVLGATEQLSETAVLIAASLLR